jgi:hypothetical protein
MEIEMTSIKKILLFVVAFWGICGLSNYSYGQSTYLSARNLGLGGGGAAYMSGYHASFINPANLGLFNGKNQFMIGLPGELTIATGGPLMNIAVYNKYFTHGYQLSNDQVDAAVNKWFGKSGDDSGTLGFNVNVMPVAFVHKTKIGIFGAALRFRTLGDISVSRGLAEFMLRGLDQSYFSQAKPVNFSNEIYSTAELSLSYATSFSLGENQRLYVGISPKIIKGLTYFKSSFKSTLKLSGDTLIQHQFHYDIYTVGGMTNDFQKFYNQRIDSKQNPTFNDFSPGSLGKGGIKGSGIGLDMGVSYVLSLDGYIPNQANNYNNELPRHTLTLSASVTDLGSVNFTKNAQEFSADNTFNWNGLKPNYQQIDAKHDSSFSNYLNYVAQDSIARNIYGAFSPGNIGSIHASLPTMIHLGAYLKYGQLGVMLDYAKGMNKVGMNSTNSSISTGVEYKLFNFIPLRVGYRSGGTTSNSFSLGTGIEFRNFQLEAGIMTVKNSYSRGYNVTTAISSLLLFF